MLEGVGANLSWSDVTLLLEPDAARIVAPVPAMWTLDDDYLYREEADEAVDFWVSEHIPECETHLPCENGSPYSESADGRYTSCGRDRGDDAAIVTDEEPTCELCAIEWRYRDDPTGYQQAIRAYFEPTAAVAP